MAPAGLARAATLTFVAARAVPPLAFPLALAGGVALARAGERLGSRRGYGAAIGAVLETFAVLGPARLGAPLAQTLTAPLVGRLASRGRGPAWQVAACSTIRVAYNTATTVFFIWVVAGGLAAYTGTWDALATALPALPRGTAAVLALTGAGIVAWSLAASVLQVHVFHRAVRGWAAIDGAAEEAQAGATGEGNRAASRGRGRWSPRFDPRAVAAAAVAASALLLASTAWPLLLAVAAFVAVAWVAARPEPGALRTGLALGAILFAGAFLFNWIGGEGAAAGLAHGVRASLLVLTATWMRGAAGAAGFREVTRRTLTRLRRLPAVPEAHLVLEEMGTVRGLGASARSLRARVRPAGGDPVAIADAVLAWVGGEARRFRPEPSLPPPALAYRPPDALLLVLALAPVLALLGG